MILFSYLYAMPPCFSYKKTHTEFLVVLYCMMTDTRIPPLTCVNKIQIFIIFIFCILLHPFYMSQKFSSPFPLLVRSHAQKSFRIRTALSILDHDPPTKFVFKPFYCVMNYPCNSRSINEIKTAQEQFISIFYVL